LRAPDAAQRFFSGPPQSRGPSRGKLMGPGSAEQRCTLHRVRDTAVSWQPASLAEAALGVYLSRVVS